MQTNIPFGDPKAVKHWSSDLWTDRARKSYWEARFIGKDDNSVIQRLTDLEKAAGDTISFDLTLRLREKPKKGDDKVEGSGEQLRFHTDTISINQLRKAADAGGKMSQKRTSHDLRMLCREKLGTYWSEYMDQLLFIYLSGDRGDNADFYEDTAYAGHANNAITAPDANHIIYGGTATSAATIAAGDKMTKTVLERAAVKTKMLRAIDPTMVDMEPTMVEGAPHFVCVMNGFQAYDLRVSDTNGWVDAVRAMTTAVGKASPIFKGGLGMISNIVLHEHASTIRFNDYGAGANVAAARALVLGKQAGAIAWGNAGGNEPVNRRRMSWSEKELDHGNNLEVAAGVIVGVKKTTFNSTDYGVLSIDTAAANPN